MNTMNKEAEEVWALVDERERLEDAFMEGELSQDELARLKSIVGDEEFSRLQGAKAAFQSYMESSKPEEFRRLLLEAARTRPSLKESASVVSQVADPLLDSLSDHARAALERLRALLPPSNQPILRFPLVPGAVADARVKSDPQTEWGRYLQSEVERKEGHFVVRAWLSDEGVALLREAEGAQLVLVAREVLGDSVVAEPDVVATFFDRGEAGFAAYAEIPVRSGETRAVLELFADQDFDA